MRKASDVTRSSGCGSDGVLVEASTPRGATADAQRVVIGLQVEMVCAICDAELRAGEEDRGWGKG